MSFETLIGKAVELKSGAATRLIRLLPPGARAQARDRCRDAALGLARAAAALARALGGEAAKMRGGAEPGPVKVDIE
jgi:hypothetical protein